MVRFANHTCSMHIKLFLKHRVFELEDGVCYRLDTCHFGFDSCVFRALKLHLVFSLLVTRISKNGRTEVTIPSSLALVNTNIEVFEKRALRTSNLKLDGS